MRTDWINENSGQDLHSGHDFHETHYHHHHGHDVIVEPTFTTLPGIATSDGVEGFEIPPDNGLAVSAAYLLQDVNSVIKWTDLSGDNAVEQPMSAFFAPLGSYGYFIDARAIYNGATGQFIASTGAVDSRGAYHLFLGISKTPDPNCGFDLYDYQYSDRTSIDQPDVAADGRTLFAVSSVDNRQLDLVIPTDGQGATSEVDLGRNDQVGVFKQVAGPGLGDYALAQNNETLTLKHTRQREQSTGAVPSTSATFPAPTASNTCQRRAKPSHSTRETPGSMGWRWVGMERCGPPSR